MHRFAAPLLAIAILACPSLADDKVAQPNNGAKTDGDKARPSVTGSPKSANNGATTVSDKEPYPSATPDAVVRVTEAVFPAVVRLDVVAEVYREGKRDRSPGIGSGVIIDKEGRVLTNYHVAGR